MTWDIGEAGHINVARGFGAWPEGRAALALAGRFGLRFYSAACSGEVFPVVICSPRNPNPEVKLQLSLPALSQRERDSVPTLESLALAPSWERVGVRVRQGAGNRPKPQLDDIGLGGDVDKNSRYIQCEINGLQQASRQLRCRSSHSNGVRPIFCGTRAPVPRRFHSPPHGPPGRRV